MNTDYGAYYDHGPFECRSRHWHCYLRVSSDSLGVLTADVEAATAEDAALLAAEKHRRSGLWTVVPGSAVKVSVGTSTQYTAKRAAG